MPDVQVSNARRITFTALALVAFWVSAFGAYSLASQLPLDLYERFGPEMANSVMADSLWTYRVPACGLLLALIPFAFLSLSRHNSPIKLSDLRILIGGLLFATCIGCCYWIGERDAWEVIAEASAYPTRWWNHRVPWLWLLLAIILTTTFVIWGAWRQAVRDAEEEAVGCISPHSLS